MNTQQEPTPMRSLDLLSRSVGEPKICTHFRKLEHVGGCRCSLSSDLNVSLWRTLYERVLGCFFVKISLPPCLQFLAIDTKQSVGLRFIWQNYSFFKALLSTIPSATILRYKRVFTAWLRSFGVLCNWSSRRARGTCKCVACRVIRGRKLNRYSQQGQSLT